MKKGTLETLASGAAQELFELELRKVLTNIMDPNTNPTAMRKITLVVKYKPDETRDMCSMEVSCESKLAPHRPVPAVAFVGVDEETGEIAIKEASPEQGELFESIQKPGKIVQM